MKNQNLRLKGLILLTSIFILFFGKSVYASEHSINYQGVIYDSSNNPITSGLDIRFSIWSDSDYTSENITESGSINVESDGFTGYSEVQTVNPDKNGNFNTAIGKINELPIFKSAIDKYLQVEVKKIGTDDSEYEVLDVDSDIDNTTDRRELSAAPYAINAETLQNYTVGSNSGNLVPLNSNGKFSSVFIENKISSNDIIIEGSDSESDIKIIFGEALGKVIKWASETLRFEIGDSLFVWGDFGNNGNVKLGDDENDKVFISGNLTLSGSLNGRDLSKDFIKLDGIEEGANSYDDTDLINKIELLKDQIENTQNTLGVSIFSWDFISGTSNHGNMFGNLSKDVNKSYVMTKKGKIISIGLTTNPTDEDADGEFFITKNDGGEYSEGTKIGSITQDKEGKGDKNNSAYKNNIEINFDEGDVLRVYHSGRNDSSSNIFIEVVFD